MMTLGPLAFAAPAALLGLIVLPIVWRLLRAAPPAPRRRGFAPWRLIADLIADDETQERTPWWLALLRLVLLALICVGLARPVLDPSPAPIGEGPLLLVIDNGWASAPRWSDTVRLARAKIDAAARAERPLALVFTAEVTQDIRLLDSAGARRLLEGARARPWPTDRAAAREAILAARDAGVLPARLSGDWLSDGLDVGDARAFSQALADFGPGSVTTPSAARLALGVLPPEASPEGLEVTVVRADATGPRTGALLALDGDGRALSRGIFEFAPGETSARATLAAPLELRNQMSLVRLEAGASAGGAQALDDNWTRPLVGLVSFDTGDDRQPLLADLHYVGKALEPFAEIRRGPLRTLLEARPGVLVLTDAGRILGPEADDLSRFVAEGGVLIRFAGPRLAARADELTPTPLRAGGREIGGALAWETPQRVAGFDRASPFFGLAPDPEVEVRRQVLAEPTIELPERTWAQLEDGTPLVTAERRGRGRIILFHVTASPEWSNLPLSGMFVGMMRRTIAFAGVGATRGATSDAGAWRLESLLDADGRLAAPPASARALDPDAFGAAPISAAAPPGRWTRGTETSARNLLGANAVLLPLPDLAAGLTRVSETDRGPRPLAGPILALVLVLAALDAVAVLALAGGITGGVRLSPARRGAVASSAVTLLIGALLILGVSGAPAQAQGTATEPSATGGGASSHLDGSVSTTEILDTEFALAALDALHLAYVVTGDARTDAMSEAGLAGLSNALRERTSIEPGPPIGVNLDRDAIGLLPLLYWPVSPTTPAPSGPVAEKLDAYMKSGGVLILDTGDAGADSAFGTAAHPGLARLAEAVDMPPLRRIDEDHVLGRAFYLLTDFPGRWRDASLWVEASAEGSARDGVSSVIITSADWAAAWAVDDDGRPLAAVSSGSPRQRELAYRTGVNVTMYVLTGNYKSDQVHIPALLDRLGQ